MVTFSLFKALWSFEYVAAKSKLFAFHHPFIFISVRGFADQRRKLKPNRNHAASRNPVKVLQKRSDITEEFPDSDGDDDEDEEDGEIISKVNFYFHYFFRRTSFSIL